MTIRFPRSARLFREARVALGDPSVHCPYCHTILLVDPFRSEAAMVHVRACGLAAALTDDAERSRA